MILQSNLRETHEASERLSAVADSFYRKQFTLALTADGVDVPVEYEEDIRRLLTATPLAICNEVAEARATFPPDYAGTYGLMLTEVYRGEHQEKA